MGDFDDWKNQYLGYVDKVIDIMPYKRMAQWKEFGLDPIANLSNPETIIQRVKDSYVMLTISLVFRLLAMLPFLVMFGAIFALYSVLTFGIPIIMLAAALGIVLLFWILSPVFSLVYCLVEYAVAKVLGGTGDYKSHFNAAMASGLAAFAFELPLLVVTVPLTWLMVIPCLGYLFMIVATPVSLAMMGISFYGIYLRFTSIRKLHGLTSGKAAATIIVPIVLWGIALIAIIVMLYLGMFAMIIGSIAATAAAGAGGAAPA